MNLSLYVQVWFLRCPYLYYCWSFFGRTKRLLFYQNMQERDVWFEPKSHVWALWVDIPSNQHTSNTEAPQEANTNRLQQILPSWLCTMLGIVEHTRVKTSCLPFSTLITSPDVQNSHQPVPKFQKSTPNFRNSTSNFENSTFDSRNSTPNFENSTFDSRNSTPNVQTSTPNVQTSTPNFQNSTFDSPNFTNSTFDSRNSTTKFTASDVGSHPAMQSSLTKRQTPCEISTRDKRQEAYKTRDDAPKSRLLYAHTRGKAMTLNQVNMRNMSKGCFLARTKDFAWLHDFARSSRVLCSAKVSYSRPPVIQECKVVGWVADYTSSHVELACNQTFFFVRPDDVEGLGLAINDTVTCELRREDNRFVPVNITRLVV